MLAWRGCESSVDELSPAARIIESSPTPYVNEDGESWWVIIQMEPVVQSAGAWRGSEG